MRVVARSALAVVFASVLLASAVGPAVASGDPAPRSGPGGGQADITVTQEFRLTPSTPGEVRVHLHFSVPNRVISLRTAVPEKARVTALDGFRKGLDREYHWDESTTRPSLTYMLPVNESLNDTSSEAAGGHQTAVDAGDWALFERPPVPTHWENYASDDPVEFHRTGTTAGPGAMGKWLVYLGEHRTYERAAHDQRFRLVVPSNANTTAAPEAILDSMTRASGALRVGDRDEDVFVVAAPTDDVAWGVRGLQTGDADLWVRDAEPVASADNAWVHEYVHSRQAFSLTPEMRWFGEASASYYAALLTFEQRRVGYDEFRDRIAAGANRSYADTVLANQPTWKGNAHYDRGTLVAGQLDRQIRDTRNGERTLQAVVHTMNGKSGPAALPDFLDYLGVYGNESVADTGRRYVGTTATLSAWNRTTHVRVFGHRPARIGFDLPSTDNSGTYWVNSSYRNTTVAADEDPIVVVAGETLRVGAVVHNADGRTGNYTAPLTVNGTVVDTANGTVAANQTATAVLTHNFTTVGTRKVGLDGDTVTVQVREPAEAHVVDFTATPTEVWAGDSVETSALVENRANVPGEATLTFRRDDAPVTTKRVRLGPNSTQWVNRSVPMSSSGTTALSIDGASPVSIAVQAPPAQMTDGDATTVSTDDASPLATTDPTPTNTRATTIPDTTNGESVSTGSGAGFEAITVGLAAILAVALALVRDRYW